MTKRKPHLKLVLTPLQDLMGRGVDMHNYIANRRALTDDYVVYEVKDWARPQEWPYAKPRRCVVYEVPRR